MDEGGGGSADISAISPGSLAEMIKDLAAKSEQLQGYSGLKRQAGEFGIGSKEFQNIINVGQWIDDELPMLRRRLTLAQALEAQAGPGQPVKLTEPVKLPSAEDLARMKELAEGLKNHNYTDEEGAKLYHEAALELAASGYDPDLMSAFFAELGPQLTPMLASIMTASGSETAAEDMKMFSLAFSAATKDTDPPQGLVDIMNQFTQPPMDDGRLVTPAAWGRLALLQEGDFPPEWLTKVVRANGLDTFAGEDADNTDFRGGSTFEVQATGLPEDVLALAFGALKNNPEAARDAIGSMGSMKDVVDRVYGYSKSYGTGDTVADAFGLAIEAGTGSGTEEPGKHSPEAAKFTYEFILASGEHKEVPWPIKDSLGKVAGSYSHEMLTGGRTDDAGTRDSGFTKPGDFTDLPGVTPAFYLSPEDTYRFLHGFADDDNLSEPFDEAMGTLQQQVTQLAAQKDRDVIAQGGQDPRNWEISMDAFGSLAGLQYQAMKDVRGSMDAFDKKVRETLSKLVTLGIGKVPTPTGFAAKWAWKGFTKLVGAGLKEYVKGGVTRVQLLESEDLQETLAMKYSSAATLVDADYPHPDIPAEIRGADGKLLSVDEIAKDDTKLQKFFEWSDSADKPPYYLDNKIDHGEKVFIGGTEYAEGLASTIKW